jgi:hypothetical protein
LNPRLVAGALTAIEATSRAADRIGPAFGRPSPRATFYHQNTPATRYWRIDLPAKFLPGKVLPAYQLVVRHYIKKQKLTFPQLRGDTAILQFPGDNGSALCAMAFEAEGKRLLVEVDDNYIDYGDELWRQRANWGRKIGDEPHTVKGHRWIVEHSSGVIVTTRALAADYGQLNDNVYVCRNSIDPSDWPNPAPRDGVFRIGWYASNSHDRDSVQVAKALSWASRQPGVEVVNIGHDPGWSFARRQVEWTDDFRGQRKELRKLDVGVAPLVLSPLAKYRSDLKALEYAMGGAMPFLQSSEPYWEWENKGFVRMCHSPADWVSALQWAVRNQDEVRWRAQQARAYVLGNRTFRTEIDRWHDAVEGGMTWQH